jgi:hypothetical protein
MEIRPKADVRAPIEVVDHLGPSRDERLPELAGRPLTDERVEIPTGPLGIVHHAVAAHVEVVGDPHRARGSGARSPHPTGLLDEERAMAVERRDEGRGHPADARPQDDEVERLGT